MLAVTVMRLSLQLKRLLRRNTSFAAIVTIAEGDDLFVGELLSGLCRTMNPGWLQWWAQFAAMCLTLVLHCICSSNNDGFCWANTLSRYG